MAQLPPSGYAHGALSVPRAVAFLSIIILKYVPRKPCVTQLRMGDAVSQINHFMRTLTFGQQKR